MEVKKKYRLVDVGKGVLNITTANLYPVCCPIPESTSGFTNDGEDGNPFINLTHINTQNVTNAGALMGSEVTNLNQVKDFDSSDYATAAQGAIADTALQPEDVTIPTSTSEFTNDGEDGINPFITAQDANSAIVIYADEIFEPPFNTVIGGMGAIWTTPTEVADAVFTQPNSSSALTQQQIDDSITEFKIKDGDIYFLMLENYGLKNSAFKLNNVGEECNLYHDFDGRLVRLNFQQFNSNSNLTSVILNGIRDITTVLAGNGNLVTAKLPKLTFGNNIFGGIGNTRPTSNVDFSELRSFITPQALNLKLPQRLDHNYFPSLEELSGQDFFKDQATTIVKLHKLETIGNNTVRFGSTITDWDTPNLKEIGGGCFRNASGIPELILPKVEKIAESGGALTFAGMTALQVLDIRGCKILGSTTGNNSVFDATIGGVTIYANVFLKTNNIGGVDGDISYAIGAGANVLWVEDFASTPETIVSDINGIEQFRSGNIQFEGFSFDAPNKRVIANPLSLNTVFVDPTNGNDTTASLQRFDKPFLTYGAAYDAIPTTNKLWVIELVGNTTFNVTRPFTKNVLISSSERQRINFSAVTGKLENQKILIIAPFCEFYFNSGVKTSYQGNNQYIEVENMYIDADPTVQGADEFFGQNLNSNYIIRNLTFYTKGNIYLTKLCSKGNFKINTYTTNSTFIFRDEETVNAIQKLTLTTTGTAVVSTYNPLPLEIAGTGQILFPMPIVDITGIKSASTNTITLTGNVLTGVRSGSFLGNLKFLITPGINTISNFVGKVNFDSITGQHPNQRTVIKNSNITIDSPILKGSSNNFTGYLQIDNSQINLTYSGDIVDFVQIQPQDVEIRKSGFLRTNATNLGEQVVVNDILYNLEGTKKIVVFYKSQIVNRVLSVDLIYEINRDIVLGAGETIIVPQGGNLTVNGYGLEASKILKNVAGEAIFTSPVGGSGGLQCQGLKLDAGLGSIFDLTAQTGNEAIEINVVNLENSSSLGTFTNFRQFLGTTIGIYGCSDGITLAGIWSGFKLSNTNIFGFGAAGTLFKAGAGLEFNSRFYAELNLSLPTGAILSDFAIGNFPNAKTFQLKNGQYTLNGSLDAATNTPSLLPNITEKSVAALFSGNVGIAESYEPFARIKGEDGLFYELFIDGTGTLTTRTV